MIMEREIERIWKTINRLNNMIFILLLEVNATIIAIALNKLL